MTAYVTASMQASKEKDHIYTIPVYGHLDSPIFATRQQIHTSPSEKLVPLFYTNDVIDLFFAQIQGSAQVVFKDGSTKLIGYHDSNHHEYYAIGKYFIENGIITKECVIVGENRKIFA